MSYTLNATSSVGTGIWSKKSGTGTVNFSSVSDPGTEITVSEYGTYTFTWTEDNNGCTSSADVVITFTEPPVANAGTDASTCGLSYTLNATSSVGTGTWSKKSGSGNVNFASVGDPGTEITASEYGTYTFTWTEDNNGCTSSADVTITLTEPPLANAGTDATVCGLSYRLNATTSVGTGLWSKKSGNGKVDFTSVSDPGTDITVSEYGVYELTWTETSGSCSSSATVTIIFTEQPDANAGLDAITCGLSYTLNANTSSGSGMWSKSEGTGTVSFMSITSPDTEITVSEYGTYTLKWTETTGGCADYDSFVTIQFIEIPTAFAGKDQIIKNINSTTLEASLKSGENGEWGIISGRADIYDNTPNSYISNLGIGENILSWTVTNGYCSDSDMVSIIVETLNPTIITPNGDGKNEYFLVNLIDQIEPIQFVVFDGRGKVVYKNSDYKNDWNGIGLDGDPLPEGTYYYLIEYSNQHVIKNYVLIKR